uniref:Uncharacterized protein n=1 Tax=Aegilops tauschii subsp. strangulata TaxID=200361 RepID=A0A453C6C1_AEGTS
WRPCSLDTEAVTPTPLHPEEAPLPREVLCTLPCVGTVLRVFSNRFSKEILHLQKDIYWARFCNITCKQEFGMWKGSLLPSSRIRLLSSEDGSVIERLKTFNGRFATQVHREPMASLHTASDITGCGVQESRLHDINGVAHPWTGDAQIQNPGPCGGGIPLSRQRAAFTIDG